MIFLKLGGSLLTDKTAVEAVRSDVLRRLSGEIASALGHNLRQGLVLGHGSGSFGHVAAARYGTRDGVRSPSEWYGFAAVADSAARLNRRVVAELLAKGVPAFALPPSCRAIKIETEYFLWVHGLLSLAAKPKDCLPMNPFLSISYCISTVKRGATCSRAGRQVRRKTHGLEASPHQALDRLFAAPATRLQAARYRACSMFSSNP